MCLVINKQCLPSAVNCFSFYCLIVLVWPVRWVTSAFTQMLHVSRVICKMDGFANNSTQSEVSNLLVLAHFCCSLVARSQQWLTLIKPPIKMIYLSSKKKSTNIDQSVAQWSMKRRKAKRLKVHWKKLQHTLYIFLKSDAKRRDFNSTASCLFRSCWRQLHGPFYSEQQSRPGLRSVF